MDAERMKVSLPRFRGGIGTILAGLILAFLLVHVAGRFYIERKIRYMLTPEQYNRLNSFFIEPLTFPPDYYTPPRIPELIQQKWDKFSDLYQRDRMKIKDNMFNGNVELGESFLPEELEEARVNMQNAEPFVNALFDLAETPGYDTYLFEYYWHYKQCKYTDLELFIGLNQKLYILEIEYRWPEALQHALAILKIARHHPAQSDLYPHGFVYTSLKHIVWLAHECNDRALINLAFKTMIREENKVLAQNPALEFEKMIISPLLHAPNYNSEVDLTPGKPLLYYYKQSLPYQEQRINYICGMSMPPYPWDEIIPIYFGLGSSATRLHISRMMKDFWFHLRMCAGYT